MQPSQEWAAALTREAAEGIVAAALEAGASVLVLAREAGAEGTGAEAGGDAADSEVCGNHWLASIVQLTILRPFSD